MTPLRLQRARLPILALTAALLTACGGSPSLEGTTTSRPAPAEPVLRLTPQRIKALRFDWTGNAADTRYRLLEDPDGTAGFSAVADAIGAGTTQWVRQVFLPDRRSARYRLEACNAAGCTRSQAVSVNDNLAAAVGYFKAFQPDAGDYFGYAVALSADGSTLAVGAPLESGSAHVVNGGDDNNTPAAGAVYVYRHVAGGWAPEAYVKGSHTLNSDAFGYSLALSADGSTLAVGAPFDDSGTSGIDTDPGAAPERTDSGALYVFQRSGNVWAQQAYIKSFNSDAGDTFGTAVALNSNGNLLAVGAPAEAGGNPGIDPPDNNAAPGSGAAYTYLRSGSTWQATHHVKASNADPGDRFGGSVALSGDGTTLAVGAVLEDSAAQGVDGIQASNTADASGAAYVYQFNPGTVTQVGYLKSSNSGAGDWFGGTLALSSDGRTLAVGALNDDALNDDRPESGAVLVFTHSDAGWAQDAYLKTPEAIAYGRFGQGLALSPDGRTLAGGAMFDGSDATGIGGDPTNTGMPGSGAVHVFKRDDTTGWGHTAYVKAPGPTSMDMQFGRSIALGVDTQGLMTMAVGTAGEDGTASGIGGTATASGATNSGAAYLY